MPNDEKEKYLLAKCVEAFRKEDYDSLLSNAQELASLSKEAQTAQMYIGIAYYYKKNFENAQKIFYNLYLKKFMKDKKEDANILYYLALCNLYNNKIESAIKILKKLEDRYPKNIEYKIMLYMAYYMLGDIADSIIELAEALDVDANKTKLTLKNVLDKALKHSQISETTKLMLKDLIMQL